MVSLRVHTSTMSGIQPNRLIGKNFTRTPLPPDDVDVEFLFKEFDGGDGVGELVGSIFKAII